MSIDRRFHRLCGSLLSLSLLSGETCLALFHPSLKIALRRVKLSHSPYLQVSSWHTLGVKDREHDTGKTWLWILFFDSS